METLELIYKALLLLDEDCFEVIQEEKDINDKVVDFQEFIKELDDYLFLDSVENLSELIDLNSFDILMNTEELDDDDINELEEMLDCASKVIIEKIDEKIESLIKLRDRF